MVTFYSTNCPKCKVLEMKLKSKNIEYNVCTDVDTMLSLGIKSAPALGMEDGKVLIFPEAVKWVNSK